MASIDRGLRALRAAAAALAVCTLALLGVPAASAAEVNVYSIWPENWARPMLQEFEAAGANNHPETQDFFSRVKGFWEGMKG